MKTINYYAKNNSWSKDRLAHSIYYNITILIGLIILGVKFNVQQHPLLQCIMLVAMMLYIVGIYIKIEILKE